MRRQRSAALSSAVAAAMVLLSDPVAGALRGRAELVRAYDAVLDADFERARELAAAACPPAPAAACATLEATRLLWRIQIDPEQTALDAAFTDAVTRAIGEAEALAAREPGAESWFYVGGAYGARVQWRVLRRQTLSAARDGKRVKQALDRALAADPSLDDAQFGLGLYEYYAAVAPAIARILRVLLLLPGGDKARGLLRMQRARTQGELLRDEATYQLHLVYLWYENRPQDGLALLRELVARHPRNPFFRWQVAQTLDVYLHDAAGSLAASRELLALARTGRVHEAALASAQARLHIGARLEAMGESDLAAAELEALVAERPRAPYQATPRAQLALATSLDRLGRRDAAAALFREVQAAVRGSDPFDLAAAARRGLQRPTPAAAGEAHRLALEAWRRVERDPAADVLAAFERALALDPGNGVARYRYARVLAARGRRARAVAELDAVLGAPATAPATIVGEAALAAGRLREDARDLDAAADYYRRAASTFGASAETRAAAERALERLHRERAPA